jgi:hypothetical protein
MIEEALVLLDTPAEPPRSLFDLKRVRENSAGWRQAQESLRPVEKRVNEFFADAAAMDVEAASLELGALRRQVPTLIFITWGWNERALVNGEDLDPTTPRRPRDALRPLRFYALEALTEFYFGRACGEHDLLAETQLAWMATQQSLLRKETRRTRRMAYRRYSELWEAWARSKDPEALFLWGR